MKNFINKPWILIISGLIVIITPYLLTRSSLIESLDFSATGQIGDTIGGITAPFINFIGFIFIYLALKEQQESNRLIKEQIDTQAIQFIKTGEDQQRQLNDQRKQDNEERITDLMYKNLDRIDRIVSFQSFVVNNYPNNNKNGYAGFNLFIKALNQEVANSNNYKNGDRAQVNNFFVSNATQLSEIYRVISNAIIVIDSLVKDSELDVKQYSSLKKLLALSLGDSVKNGTIHLNNFIHNYIKKKSQKMKNLNYGLITKVQLF